jgi:hypothetical protein
LPELDRVEQRARSIPHFDGAVSICQGNRARIGRKRAVDQRGPKKPDASLLVSLPLAASQASSASETARIEFPSALKPSEETPRPLIASSGSNVAVFHVWMICLSGIATAKVFPSGEKAIRVTSPPRSSSVRSRVPLAASQTLTARSQLPVATSRPSGEKATAVTASVWPNCGTMTACCASMAGGVVSAA